MRTMKKVLTLALSIMMIVGMFTANAFAESCDVFTFDKSIEWDLWGGEKPDEVKTVSSNNFTLSAALFHGVGWTIYTGAEKPVTIKAHSGKNVKIQRIDIRVTDLDIDVDLPPGFDFIREVSLSSGTVTNPAAKKGEYMHMENINSRSVEIESDYLLFDEVRVYYSEDDIAPEPLCFTAEAANSSVKLVKDSGNNKISLTYSVDGVNWKLYEIGSKIELANVGDAVYFKAEDNNTSLEGYRFNMTGEIAASGSVMALLNGYDTLAEIPSEYCFNKLFMNCESLTALPELPATVLPRGCYSSMFEGCDRLGLAEQGNTTCYKKTFRIPSGTDGTVVSCGNDALKNMVNGKTLQPGVTYYYDPHHKNIEQCKGKDSTCIAAGYKDYYYCTDCKLYFSDSEGRNQIVDVDAWKKSEGKIAIKPHSLKKVKGNYVCTGTGWKDYYKCTNCDKHFSDKAGKYEITDLVAWKAGDGKLVNPGHFVGEWFVSKSYHFGECKYCGIAITANHSGSPCGVCGYEASEVQDPEDDEEYILDEEATAEPSPLSEEESGNPQEVSSIFSNGSVWIVLVIGLAAIAGIAVVAVKKNKE